MFRNEATMSLATMVLRGQSLTTDAC